MASVPTNSELIGASPVVHARVAGLVGVIVLASGSFAGFVASRLAVASVPLYMLNQVNQFAALLLASDQLYEHVEPFLELRRLGNLIAAVST